jgi:hypothetical protein
LYLFLDFCQTTKPVSPKITDRSQVALSTETDLAFRLMPTVFSVTTTSATGFVSSSLITNVSDFSRAADAVDAQQHIFADKRADARRTSRFDICSKDRFFVRSLKT